MRLSLTLISLCAAFLSQAQGKLVYLDASNKPVSKKNAVTMDQHLKINDTVYEVNTYKMDGPCITSIQYNDPNEGTRNGRYIAYDGGVARTVGRYAHGLKDGRWVVPTSEGRTSHTEYYSDGQLIGETDSTAASTEIKMPGDTTDKIYSRVEKEAEIRGGTTAWLQYMNSNLRYPYDAASKFIQGVALVRFVIEKDGNLLPQNVYIVKSLEFSLDMEALRIIRYSPRWKPATQDGRNVRSFKVQPIVFKLTPH